MVHVHAATDHHGKHVSAARIRNWLAPLQAFNRAKSPCCGERKSLTAEKSVSQKLGQKGRETRGVHSKHTFLPEARFLSAEEKREKTTQEEWRGVNESKKHLV